MVNMLHRILSPNTKLPNRPASGRRSGPKFGAMTRDQLEAYRPVLNRVPLVRAVAPARLTEAYEKWLTPQGQDQLERVCQFITPAQLDTMNKTGKLGVLKPASNLLFGLYVLTAARLGVITEKSITEMGQDLLPQHRDSKSFDRFLQNVGDALPKNKKEAFVKLVGGDPRKARELLSLIAVRAVLARQQDPKYSLAEDARGIMDQGLKNFDQALPWYSPRRLQAWLTKEVYQHLSFLPVEWYRSQLQGMVRERLNVGIRYEDIISDMHHDEMRSQEARYRRPQLSDWSMSDECLKPVEALFEAAVVKHAALWHPDGKAFQL